MVGQLSIYSILSVKNQTDKEKKKDTFVTLEKHAVVMTLTVLASFLRQKKMSGQNIFL